MSNPLYSTPPEAPKPNLGLMVLLQSTIQRLPPKLARKVYRPILKDLRQTCDALREQGLPANVVKITDARRDRATIEIAEERDRHRAELEVLADLVEKALDKLGGRK